MIESIRPLREQPKLAHRSRPCCAAGYGAASIPGASAGNVAGAGPRGRHPAGSGWGLRVAVLTLLLSLFAGSAGAQQQEPLLGEAEGAEAAAEFYEKALIAHNKGDVRSAYIFLKNSLREDPLLLPAHLLLGRIYLDMGQGEQAEKQLLIADGLGAHRSLIQNSLARAYLMQGRPQQLLDELFPVGTAPEEDAELLALRGEAHLALEQYFDAQRSFTQAWELNPRSAAAILGRVHVMLLQGELEKAMALAREAVAVAPTSPRAWYLKGVLAESMGDYSGALSDLTEAAELLPAYLPAQTGRVNLMLRLGRLSEADAVASEVQEIYPNDPRSHYLKAVVQTKLGNEQAAEEALQAGSNLIARFPRELIEGHRPTLLLAGIIAFTLKQWEQAEDYLSIYLAEDGGATGPRVLLARIALEQRGEPERAIRLLESAVERTPGNVPALSLLAEAYMKTGQHLQAAQLLRTAQEQRKGDIMLRTQQAVNEFGLGRRDDAIDELSQVFNTRPELSNAGATLIVMLLQERDNEAALAGARKLLLRVPDNLSYVNLLGAAAFAKGDMDTARWAFELALAIDPAFHPARTNLAELLLRAGDVELARGHLQRVLDTEPEEVNALMLLARSHEAEGDLGQALRLAERALAADPAAVRVAIYQTELLLRMREPDKAVRVAESVEVRSDNPDDADLLATLSRAYIASGRRATAQVVLRRGSSLAGYDARRLLKVALLQRDAGDIEGALWSLQKATEGEPDYLPARLRFGELLIEHGRTDEALELARVLRLDYPERPYADHLTGLVLSARGEHIAAFEAFSRALDRTASPLLALRAYEAKRDGEGMTAGVEFLQAWHDANPGDGVVTQTLAEGYYALGDHQRALALFEQALAQAPDNPMLLNNLAVIYNELGDPRALPYARRAHELMPNAAETGDTLGWVLVSRGEFAEGLKYLRDAQTRAAGDPGISYHIAVALKGLGRTDEAMAQLTRLLQTAHAGFADRDKAARLLEELRNVRAAQSG
ncbi:XrtA/PEP-CTERM system TPR-repeat protein PrsT [uncultured Thiohalocapsa sp.]|uniref:XrtA/PEP-CTERM system TPR-repeat protein PrsT n=1 Tax=uncultured Thiohalocapsa sp. TaxID=768990 RepID=UPI0025FE8406|nr:XrtA/PEP-CTERM system TPR-repeat protein PrsT [uncultured Thiohalocapsa sp.]